MSGGYIGQQAEGGHQVVIFTFLGALKPDGVRQWNDVILELKRMFGPNLVGLTIKSQPTPPSLRKPKKPKRTR